MRTLVLAGLAALALAALPAGAAASGAPASTWSGSGMVRAPGGAFLRDRYGRRLQLHGVNLVAKCGGGAVATTATGTPCVGSPFGPQPAFVLTPTASDPGRRFTAADARTLARLGFNSVRLGIIWQGLEPGPEGLGPDDPRFCAPHAKGTPFPSLGATDPYDAATVKAYLAKVDRTVRLLGAAGIRVQIDMHQDAYGSAFSNAASPTPWNGEGAPAWATCTDGKTFGSPGSWMSTYTDPAGEAAIHHFFQNDVRANLQGHFARVWKAVARHFRGNRTVLGYDVHNEPADVTAGDFDRELQCFYAGPKLAPESCRTSGTQAPAGGVIGAIRSADPTHVVFYEPSVLSNFGVAQTIGIAEPLRLGNLGLAFHPYTGKAALDKVLADRRRTHTKQRGGPALYANEFGATSNAAANAASAAMFESEFVSWSYWAGLQLHDPTGAPDEALLDEQTRRPYPAQATALARAYPAATAGRPTHQAYHPATGRFEFAYRPDRGVHAPTLIVLPARAYPHGYRVVVSGATVVSRSGARVLELQARPHAKRVSLTVRRRPAAASSAAAGPKGPGCDRGRPAVAHHSGGVRIPGRRRPTLVPCETFVGRTSEAASVGVTRRGSVFYAPLLENTSPPPQNTLQGPEWVVRSRNLGRTWTKLGSGGPRTAGLVPPWMTVDSSTSRIWFTTTLPGLCGAQVSWSDDDGKRWRTGTNVPCPSQGGQKLLEGPAPRVGAKPHGYPHVVYYCGNTQDIAASNLWCYRSLNGGRTFKFTGAFPDPPRPPGCDERHPSRPGVVGADGALYFPTTLCGTLGLAISRDEGKTWRFRAKIASGLEDIYTTGTAADRHGGLYFAFRGPRDLPYLTTSTDRGRTWSKPRMVGAPGVREVRRVAVAVGRHGEVGLAYAGTTDGMRFNGYITETRNALARRPLFWSASINKPSAPLLNAADPEVFGDRFFYGGAAVGPDGTVWAGFHCARTSACPGRRVGVVGRLSSSP
jgi:cellulase (glycosyl hydrolase family 5)/glycosyl hydrolase family 5